MQSRCPPVEVASVLLLLLLLHTATAALQSPPQAAAEVGHHQTTGPIPPSLTNSVVKVVEVYDEKLPPVLGNYQRIPTITPPPSMAAAALDQQHVALLVNATSAPAPANAVGVAVGAGGSKRVRHYVVPDGYTQMDNGTLVESLNLPDEHNGVKISRWVLCSYVVANVSMEDAFRHRNMRFLEEIPTLLKSAQSLVGNEVYAFAAASIVMAFNFTGIKADSLSPEAAKAVTKTASDMAGGYNPALISVSTTYPGYAGGTTAEFSVSVADGASMKGPLGRRRHSYHRRLLEQQHQQQQYVGDVLQLPAQAAVPHRSLQQQQDSAAANSQPAPPSSGSSSGGSAGGSSNAMPVWLMYKYISPSNTTALTQDLYKACGLDIVKQRSLPAGFDFTTTACGAEIKTALKGAGVEIDDASYSQILAVPPTVTLSVRLAIGMTAAQVSAGTDETLRNWLAEPSTAQMVARVYAPDAVIRWLHAPQIYPGKAQPQPPSLTPGAAAGVAVGGAVVLCSIVLLGVWLFFRHKRKRQGSSGAGGGFKPEDTDSQSSGRRRRRQGKRRYLLPDAPRPDSQPALPAGAGGSAGASSSGLNGAAAGAAGAAAGDMPAVGDDDTDLSPDQIRPQLRSLGDSVTSAVRYEQSDEEEEVEGGQRETGAAGGPAAAGVAAVGIAAGAAAAAGAAGASSSSRGAGGAESSAAASRRAVLDARAALVAEYQQRQQQHDAAAGSSSSRPSGAGGDGLPAVVSPELAAAAEISSAVIHTTPSVGGGHYLLGHQSSSAGGSSSGAGAGAGAADATHQQQQLLKPVDERAAAASAAAVAAAAALPQSGAVQVSARRASPFANAYNFNDLAAGTPAHPAAAAAPAVSTDPAAAAAAMAAASARAVTLPPRGLPSPLSPRQGSSGLTSPGSVGSGGLGDVGGGSGNYAANGSSAQLVSQAGQAAPDLSVGGASRERRSSNGSSVGGGSNGLLTSPRGGAPAAAAAGGGPAGKVFGLQHLVSITPIRGAGGDGSGGAAADAIIHNSGSNTILHTNVLLQPVDSAGASSSQLQGASTADSYVSTSTLQLSSSDMSSSGHMPLTQSKGMSVRSCPSVAPPPPQHQPQ